MIKEGMCKISTQYEKQMVKSDEEYHNSIIIDKFYGKNLANVAEFSLEI